MAWLYVPELEALNSDSESSGPASEPFVMLSGKATQRPLSWRGWASRPWIKLLSGLHFPISTASRGAAKWIASLEASRASHSVWPESVEDSQTNDGLATICSGWSMKYEIQPGGSSSCWRTSQVSLFTDSQASSEDWKQMSRAGGVQNGCVYPRQPWVPLTGVNASSDFSWPTPAAQEPGFRHIEVVDKEGNPPAHGNQRWYHPQTGRVVQKGLEQVATRWPTPNAGDGIAGASDLPHRQQVSLPRTAAKWPPGPLGLPTVTAGESGSPQEGQRQRLNPNFVEALMGLPPGWSLPTIGCGASGTQLWLSRQRQRLASLLGV